MRRPIRSTYECRPFVNGQIVHEYDVAGAQGRNQYLCDIHFKGGAIHRSFQQPRSLYTLRAEGGNQCIVGSGVARRSFDDALSRVSSSKVPGEPQIRPAFIDEFQVSELSAPFIGDPLSKQVTQAANTWCVPQTIMQ